MRISQSVPTIFLYAMIQKNTIVVHLHEIVLNKESLREIKRLREGFCDN